MIGRPQQGGNVIVKQIGGHGFTVPDSGASENDWERLVSVGEA